MKTDHFSRQGTADERSLGATRERVLDVAERLFAERGLDAVSIRDITGEAGANLGAINYHFGTKEKLIRAVIERRIKPVSEAMLRGLGAVEEAAGAKPPKLEAVLEAMFRPAVEQAMDTHGGSATFCKLMARCFFEPKPAVEMVVHSHFAPVEKRFDAIVLRVLPKLTAEDAFWRMHLLWGALHQSLLQQHRKRPIGKILRIDAETYIKRFVAFGAAVFRAPLPE